MLNLFMTFLFLSSLGIIGIQIYNFLSGRRFLHDLWDAFAIQNISLQTADSMWQNTKKSDIIVSLTTIPSRLFHLEFVLKSLLTQSLAPQKIKLYIPPISTRENCSYIVPEFFKQIKGLEIIQTTEQGPATKFIPAIQSHEPEQLLLIVDDDKIYDKNLVQRFHDLSKTYPEVVIASSGWIVPEDLIDKPTSLYRNLFLIPPTPIHGSRIKLCREVDVVMGCSGFLIKPKFFDYEALINRSSVPQALWYVDDVWISGHCKVKKIVFPADRCCFQYPTLEKLYRKTSLGLINKGKGSYLDRHNTVGIRHFKEKWLCFSSPKRPDKATVS